jgi:hypothetical protein
MTKPTSTLIVAPVSEPTTVIDTTITTITAVTPVASPVKTVLDFEDAMQKGLVPSSYFQGSAVSSASTITDQYISSGFVMEHAALANLGVGHAASGTMAIAPVSALGKVDYDAPVTFHFVKEVDTSVTKTVTQVATSTTFGEVKGNGNSIPTNNDNSIATKNANGATPVNDHNAEVISSSVTKSATATTVTANYVDGTVNYFAYSPDTNGRSFNTITITAFALDGHKVGQISVRETANITAPIVLSGIGEFHSVTIDSTLRVVSWGGIAIDNLTIGEVHANVQPSSQTSTTMSEVTLVGVFDEAAYFNPAMLVGIP